MNNYTCFESIATTYIITAGQDNSEYYNFIQRFNQISRGVCSKENTPLKHCKDNMWLLKPANFNQGKGIEIFRNVMDIISFINTRQPNSMWVAQKYIEKPLLFKDRKFDIRVWVLISPKGDLLFHKYPYVRTSSFKYETSAKDNYVHLTNNCLQQKNQNYGQFEEGNTIPIQDLFDYIQQLYPEEQNLGNKIMARFKDLIIDSFLAVKNQLIYNKRDYCFELFGYDFLIDEDLRTWLIEVNLNPYLGTPNQYIKNLLPKMVQNMLQLIVDPYFKPINEEQSLNEFEIIYSDMLSDINNHQQKNVRQPFNTPIYPIEKLKQLSNRQHFRQQFEKEQAKQLYLQIQLKQKKDFKQNQQNTQSQNNSNNNNNNNKTKQQNNQPQNQQQSQKQSSNNNKQQQQQNAPKSQQQQNNNNKTQLSQNNSQMQQTQNQQQTQQPSEDKNSDPQNKNTPIQNNNNINTCKDLFFTIKKQVDLNSIRDVEQFQKQIQVCLNKLLNWELIDEEKDLNWVIQALQLVSESRMSGIFQEQANINMLIKIIASQQFLLKIQLLALNIIKVICTSNAQAKVNFLQKSIIHSLMHIALASIDPQKKHDYDQKLAAQAIKCLIILGGIYDRKIFIPGETRKNDCARKQMIEDLGLISLIQIHDNISDTNDTIQQEIKQFFQNLEIIDYEYQLKLIQEYKQYNKLYLPQGKKLQKSSSIQNSKDSIKDDNEEGEKQNDEDSLSFLSIEPSNNSMLPNIHEKTISETVKQNLLRIQQYNIDISQIESSINEIIASRYEQTKLMERKQEMKKQIELIENQRQHNKQQQAMEQKKKKLDEIKKKRDNQNKLKSYLEKQKQEQIKQQSLKDQEEKKKKYEQIIKKKKVLLRKKIEEAEKRNRDEEIQKQKIIKEFKKIKELSIMKIKNKKTNNNLNSKDQTNNQTINNHRKLYYDIDSLQQQYSSPSPQQQQQKKQQQPKLSRSEYLQKQYYSKDDNVLTQTNSTSSRYFQSPKQRYRNNTSFSHSFQDLVKTKYLSNNNSITIQQPKSQSKEKMPIPPKLNTYHKQQLKQQLQQQLNSKNLPDPSQQQLQKQKQQPQQTPNKNNQLPQQQQQQQQFQQYIHNSTIGFCPQSLQNVTQQGNLKIQQITKIYIDNSKN